jgi:hypothetical protein
MSAKEIRFDNNLRDLLLEASSQFVRYAQHHLAKTPPEFVKAKVNMAWAERCHNAATNTPDPPPEVDF